MRLLALLLSFLLAEGYCDDAVDSECTPVDSSGTCLISDSFSMMQSFQEPLLHRSRTMTAFASQQKFELDLVQKSHKRGVVWINAFARSGSSLIEAMITNSGSGPTPDAFALFEPCHEGDKYDQELEEAGCPAVLSRLAECNFDGIHGLWGWNDRHTTNGGHEHYTQSVATKLCKESNLIVLKTIDYVNNLRDVALPVLQQIPHLRIITVIRDPRAIWASRRSVPGNFEGENCISKMLEMCDTQSANRNILNSRFYHLVFEDLIKSPTQVTREVQKFLGRPFGSFQEAWIKENFNADCGDEAGDPYSVCRENSTSSLYKYRQSLSNDEFAAFMAHKQCREISAAYGYQAFYHHEKDCDQANKRFNALVDTPMFALGVSGLILFIMILCWSQTTERSKDNDLTREV
jgi:hypothetical protein